MLAQQWLKLGIFLIRGTVQSAEDTMNDTASLSYKEFIMH